MDWGNRSRNPSVQNIYAAIMNTHPHTVVRGWRKIFWYWHIPPNIKHFTWLMIAYKLNTWDIVPKNKK
jgi:hypothetical protein